MLKSFRAYLAAHRRVRIALIVVLVLLAALLILHPKIPHHRELILRGQAYIKCLRACQALAWHALFACSRFSHLAAQEKLFPRTYFFFYALYFPF